MLITACDQAYLGQARALIQSSARHEPDQRFLLFLVNGESVSDASIRSWHPRIIIERANWKSGGSDWRGEMACARAIPILKALEDFADVAIYLDSDTLIRSSLKGIREILETADLTVVHRPELESRGPAGTPYFAKFNSGVLGIRPSRCGLRLAQRFKKSIEEHRAAGRPMTRRDPTSGFEAVLDQELLYLCYLELEDEITFTPLPASFNDAGFHPHSAVWHGKGTARRHPLFRVESARYRWRFGYLPLGWINSGLASLRSIRQQVKRGRIGA